MPGEMRQIEPGNLGHPPSLPLRTKTSLATPTSKARSNAATNTLESHPSPTSWNEYENEHEP
jgi:hypothetical protein